jgi:ATP-dependent helicase/DNAse subunit B
VSLTLITGPANAGKAEVVMGAVRRHLAHGEEPLLIVPTRADAEHYLRELAGAGVAIGARVERFTGLVDEAARRAGVDAQVLSVAARRRVLELVAARGGAPSSPGFVRALAELFAQLRLQRVTPARLGHALSAWRRAEAVSGRAADLARLFADYCATLERLGRTDEEGRAMSALDALRERPGAWGRAPVLFYGFDDLTRLQLDAIETLARLVDAPVTVSLSYEAGRVAFAGRAHSFHALLPLASEHRQMPPRSAHYAPRSRTALAHIERSLFEAQAPRLASEQLAGAVRLLEGGGQRAELELVASEILDLLDGGMEPAEIAVVVRPPGLPQELLEEVFSTAGVPFPARRATPFVDTAIGRALVGLLRCVPIPRARPSPGGAPRRSQAGELADLLAWLRVPGLLERPELADWLELTARRSGVVDAVAARALWERRNWPLETIDQLLEAQGRGAAALCDRAARELYWLFCAPRRAGARVLAAEELQDAGALAVGRRALAELRELARSAPELAPAHAGALAETLARLEVVGDEREGDPTDAVAVLDPLALRARRVRVLFACGLQEGVFPARARPQPLLAEEERWRLAEVSGLRLGEHEDLLAAERYLFYAALSRPQEQLFLSWHVADDDGEPTPRSLFVDDVCDLFGEELMVARARRRVGAVEAIGAGAGASAAAPAGQLPCPLRCAARPLSDERLLAWLQERVWSASSLEKWIGCPVSWFVERMLDPARLDPDPEPLARGALAHAALKDTLEGLRRERGSARLEPAALGRARELLASALAANEAERPLSVLHERELVTRRRLRADLERYLRHAAEHDSGLEPSALELEFGFDEQELPALELGDGVRLRGRIDRVDVGERGEAVVYDYKGGRAPFGARWIKDGDLQVALYMHAVEQLLHLRAVGGFYQPLTGADLRPRGVLDGDAGLELGAVSTDVYEHVEVRALLAQALDSARAAAAEAGRGKLQSRPHTCAYRGGCMYPAICRCEP